MTRRESSRLIDAAGGDIAFAELIGIASHKHVRQRVNNWRRRGIPTKVLLQYRDLFDSLQKRPS
jgi:hypothetical protein